MATYNELFALRSNADLRNRITAAIAVKCDEIRLEADTVPNYANRRLWAKEALTAPDAMAEKMMWGILAANRAFTSAQIAAAGDTALLSAVNDLVNVYATTPITPA